jgi:hypothetical protein
MANNNSSLSDLSSNSIKIWAADLRSISTDDKKVEYLFMILCDTVVKTLRVAYLETIRQTCSPIEAVSKENFHLDLQLLSVHGIHGCLDLQLISMDRLIEMTEDPVALELAFQAMNDCNLALEFELVEKLTTIIDAPEENEHWRKEFDRIAGELSKFRDVSIVNYDVAREFRKLCTHLDHCLVEVQSSSNPCSQEFVRSSAKSREKLENTAPLSIQQTRIIKALFDDAKIVPEQDLSINNLSDPRWQETFLNHMISRECIIDYNRKVQKYSDIQTNLKMCPPIELDLLLVLHWNPRFLAGVCDGKPKYRVSIRKFLVERFYQFCMTFVEDADIGRRIREELTVEEIERFVEAVLFLGTDDLQAGVVPLDVTKEFGLLLESVA